MHFSELELNPALQRSLRALEYDRPTPIQERAIPIVLAERDLMGCAQTGTGKTAAFALPMLELMMRARATSGPAEESTAGKNEAGGKRSSRKKSSRSRAPRGLILTPTRELACQISESLKKYGRHLPLKHTLVFGGVSQVPQVNALRRGVDIVVATPGRLLDLWEQGELLLDQINLLVLDEADQMLDMGFLPALKRIVAATPSQRQTLMFSATMPADIRELALKWLRQPEHVEVAAVSTPAERIEQSVCQVAKADKPEMLVRFLRDIGDQRTLVFCRTKHGADKIVKRLDREGISASAIHGNKSQRARQQALERFKREHPPVLVATDIAARGLDISGVAHVINFELPETPETYVHRIGRTARAGASGSALSFCSREEFKYLRQIERLIRRKIPLLAGFETDQNEPERELRDNHANRMAASDERRDRDAGDRGRRGGSRPANARRPGRSPQKSRSQRGSDRSSRGAEARTGGDSSRGNVVRSSNGVRSSNEGRKRKRSLGQESRGERRTSEPVSEQGGRKRATRSRKAGVGAQSGVVAKSRGRRQAGKPTSAASQGENQLAASTLKFGLEPEGPSRRKKQRPGKRERQSRRGAAAT